MSNPPTRAQRYNDFDIVSTFLSALASTDAVTPVLARVVVITLRDVSC